MESTPDWNLIVEDLGPKLYRYFAARFGDTLADDLTQETLIRLVSKYKSGDFDESRGTLLSYAFGIARFVRLEALKKPPNVRGVFEDEVEMIADDFDLHENIETEDELNHLRFSISSLPEPQQEIILLMIESEFSLEKISQHLEMPTGTVKSHVHRAKKSLLSKLSKTLGGPYGRQI